MFNDPAITRRRALQRGCAGLGGAVLGSARADEQPTLLQRAVPGGRVELQLAGAFSADTAAALPGWVDAAAAAVAGYFGRFPLPRVELLIQALPGAAGVRGGTTFGEPEPFVRLRVGSQTTAAQLRDDWVLVHEMVHLALPRVPRASAWLHEGVATYVEGIARVRAGQLAAGVMWASLVAGLPLGQPADGDRGLDHTPTWGRTYWGGAMFCLLADVRIRQRSALEAGLQQALRGVTAAGGHYGQVWPVSRILRVADAAVGQDTLSRLYDEMKDSPVTVALEPLWQRLGVHATGPLSAEFDDRAEAAGVRRAIVAST
ncbi:MAG: hypothetical protein HY021_12190 [Burkholderiales bacterium]|nr:hypothetical protein [Burkholderiales bacterium]